MRTGDEDSRKKQSSASRVHVFARGCVCVLRNDYPEVTQARV